MSKAKFIPPGDVLSKIERFSETSGLSPATVCKYAAHNWRLYEQLKSTGDCRQVTARKVLAYIAKNPNRKRKRQVQNRSATAPVPAE